MPAGKPYGVRIAVLFNLYTARMCGSAALVYPLHLPGLRLNWTALYTAANDG